MYLEKRRRRWYACHEIPPRLRHLFSGSKRFIKSLETEDKQEAKRRAIPLEIQWRREIQQAEKEQHGQPSTALTDGEYWRRVLDACATPVEREIVQDLLIDRLDAQLAKVARQVGHTGDLRDLDHPASDAAVLTFKIATGEITRTDAYIEDWLATKADHIQPKTLEMYRSDLAGRLSKRFPYLQDITKASVTNWISKDLLQTEGLNRRTLGRLLPACRGYWRYLQDLGHVPSELEPFNKLTVAAPKLSSKAKTRDSDRRAMFEKDSDVLRLISEAEERQDHELANLIRLGMWTGARIGELCSLRCEDVQLETPIPHFKIIESKTSAGVRAVPIHPEILPVMKVLKGRRVKGFLFPDLKPNKYGDRSDAIGKRFGRLKSTLGFGPKHGFHSLRHTVITKLLNAGVSHPVVAALVGHDMGGDSVTLGVYHKGFGLDVLLREGLSRLVYGG